VAISAASARPLCNGNAPARKAAAANTSGFAAVSQPVFPRQRTAEPKGREAGTDRAHEHSPRVLAAYHDTGNYQAHP
jgi:hypothetical protein